MSWEGEISELGRRKLLAQRMGGDERVAQQRDRGKLTARERLDLLADKESFREFFTLVGHATYHGDELVDFTPKSQVDGQCLVNGRPVIVHASDFTVRGGSGFVEGLGAEPHAHERAAAQRIPFVRLLDAVGGSVQHFEDIGRTYLPDGNIWSSPQIDMLNQVPIVSAVLGSVAGGPAVAAPLSHWSVMVKGISQLFPGGPPVVKAALGVDIDKETLGGWEIHGRMSGVVDNVAEDEADAFEQIRTFLSYLPSSVDELPPREESDDPVDRRDESLTSLVPRDPRQPHDAYKLVRSVVDEGSFFEINALYGRSRITGLGRVGGHPVGIMANNPMHLGGSTDVAAGEKSIRFISLCDTFHIPIVSLADEPGFMVGIESERAGIERAGARLVWSVCTSRVPWLTVVIRRLYGVAGQCHHRPTGMFRRYAWPSARWGSMHIQGGASAAYKREIDNAPDPEAKRIEIEQRLEALASPFRTAEATGQDIIDPRDTRRLIYEFLDDAQRVLLTQLGPPPYGYRP